jgi:hypothetical protein
MVAPGDFPSISFLVSRNESQTVLKCLEPKAAAANMDLVQSALIPLVVTKAAGGVSDSDHGMTLV